jgi:hypothetical protein
MQPGQAMTTQAIVSHTSGNFQSRVGHTLEAAMPIQDCGSTNTNSSLPATSQFIGLENANLMNCTLNLVGRDQIPTTTTSGE